MLWPSHARLPGSRAMALNDAQPAFCNDTGMAHTSWLWAYRSAASTRSKSRVLSWISDPLARKNQTMPPLHLTGSLGIEPWVEAKLILSSSEADAASARDLCDQSPIHYATQQGQLDVIKLLLNKGFAVDERSVFTAASEGHMEVLKLLLARGHNPDARGRDLHGTRLEKETALWEATGCVHEDIVRVMLA
ncbi:hypothetical protein BDU57DRAFT_213047 [Ampelomyces quisqualis]|uniref:Uncharacterized protein n=1 Tax=Ampelomyces quisqualis TaxID=50730 RepID=A0A6A5QPQ8_AMPQU|nr:hypothetical protein BDU57DRAFT_213047 [Ampelomyces quisqualis]